MAWAPPRPLGVTSPVGGAGRPSLSAGFSGAPLQAQITCRQKAVALLRCGVARCPRGVTWLILPVVICLSQRLSHACLSISNLYGETANGSLNQLSFI